MPAVRVIPEVLENGDVYLVLLMSDGSTDRVGPLQQDQELIAILEAPSLGGPSPPTRRMKNLSRRQERRNAELLGGRQQPASGASPRAKGDIRKFGEYRGESKFTFSKAFSLERAVLEKIMSECAGEEKPIVFIDFKDKDTGRTHGSYVVLHETDFEKLVNHAPSDGSGSSSKRRG